MPYANCCVRLCVSSTRRTPDLEFYRLPEEGDERRGEWLRLIRNDALTREPASHLTRICGLHFQLRRGDVNPSVFPWTNDWPSVIRQYNKGLSENGEPLPILTPETTGVDVPRTGTCSADEGQRNMNNKGKKRLRIWVDESEGEEEAIGKGEEESTSGSYMVTPEKLGPTSERRVAEGVTGTVVPTQRSGEVVSMVMTPGGPKMSVHEKAFFSPYHSSQLLNKLADLWRMGKMCDATVCIGYTIRIKAHKLVLSAMSSVIMNMAAKTEGAILELQLPGDLNVESVQKFITFLYEGVLYLSPSTVHDVQRLAAIFKVSSVQGYCETFLQSSHMAKSQPLEPQPPPTVPAASSPSPALSVPFQMVAPLNTSIPKPSSGTASPVLGAPSFQPVRLSPKLTSLSADSGIWSKRPVLRQQATVHGDEDLPQFPKYPKDSMLPSKRVQELKGLWKKGSYETSDDRSSPGLMGSDQILGSPLTTEGGSFQSTDSPGGSFDQPDLTQVKTEPEDSATESGDENSALLPGTVMFRVDGGEGMDPPDAPGTTRGRTRAVGSEQTLGNSDPALLTQQVRSAMPQTGVLFENLPIPDGFLSESNPEQQRRYMASLLERTQTSAIPERDRMYRCLFCPSSFVKAKSCVVHVIETHQVQAKDVLKYVSIERKGAKTKPKCPLCDYKVTKNQDHLHYHKYFQHGIPLPEGFQLYRCEICGKESSSKYNWRTHMDTCHFQGNTCEMCEQQFGSREELADHYRSIHISARRASPPKKRLRRLTKNVSAPADTSQSRHYVYKCPDCSFDSSLRDDIVTHMTTVHGRDMEIPELQRADCGTSHDKDQLLRTQSDDRAERLDRGKSEDMDDGKEGAEGEGGAEETGSMSAHSEYDCESPDSSMAHTKEME